MLNGISKAKLGLFMLFAQAFSWKKLNDVGG